MKSNKPDQAFDAALRLHRSGRLEDAAEAYRKIIMRRPAHAAALCNLGVILRKNGQFEAAREMYARSLRYAPRDGSTWSNLSGLLWSMGRKDEALQAARKAVMLAPSLPAAHDNLGNVLFQKLCFDEAEAALLNAIVLSPEFANAWNNLGQVYQRQSRLADAAGAYQRAVLLDPAFDIAFSNLLFCMHFGRQWQTPEIFSAHLRWGQQFERSPLAHAPIYSFRDRVEGSRPRVGFISPDLFRHPVSVFLKPLIAHWPQDKFELGFFASVRAPDDMTDWFKEQAAHWCDIYSMNDAAAAKAVASWQPDILIDLAGHTGGGRLRLLAHRLASVQMSWLGYFDTTGMKSVHYVIADPVSVPTELEKYFTEKVLRLPHGFVCFDPPESAPEPGPLPALTNGFITFGSQNQLAKITEDVLFSWAELLRCLPRARLLFQAMAFNDSTAREKYTLAFVRLGIEPGRIEFLPATSPKGILANYRRIDIALDPFPCTGGTTTCESLWMGVPVVTLIGDRFGGRHSASHITNVGLGQLVASSPDQYLAIAAALGSDIPRLADIRHGLRERMRTSPLCDGQRFADDFAELLLSRHFLKYTHV